MSEATQQGASVQERLEALLAAEEAPLQPEAAPEQDDEPEAAEEHEEPDADEDAAEDDEEASEDAQESDEPRIELSHLAEYLGIDEDKLAVDDDGKVCVRTKVDGEEGRAKLADLVKSYQLEGHLNKRNMEVAEQQKALQAKQAELEQQAQARLQQLDDLAKLAVQELQQDYQAVNWSDLEQNDPAEYARLQIKFQQRQQRLSQAMQQMQAERERVTQTQREAYQRHLREESQRLLQAIPEWVDEAVAKKERAEIRSFALETGFRAEEVDNIADHRVVKLLRDAMRYRTLQQSKAEVTKKVRTAPKLVRPGQAPNPKEQAAQNLSKLKSAVRKSGGKEGIEALLIASGKV